MESEVRSRLIAWAEEYNDEKYFREDPIVFPKRFHDLYRRGKCSLADIEVAAVFAAHFAWGRRAMIVRDCTRLFDEMSWKPYDYVMRGTYRSDDASIHRTVKWSEVAAICGRLKGLYSSMPSIESLTQGDMRVGIFGQKPDPKAPDKKIRMMCRWMVRNDGKVDLGLWKKSSPADLIVPLDVHVYTQAVELGLTKRRQKDLKTAEDITAAFREIWPDDPLLGDFALFGYGVTR